jgi:uncharacterized protein (UPF0335 family)
MEIRTPEEAIENIMNYARALLELQQQKKNIDDDIKELKQNFKEEGVAVGKVTKVLNKIKSEMKQSESDKVEEEIIKEHLEREDFIQTSLAVLNG